MRQVSGLPVTNSPFAKALVAPLDLARIGHQLHTFAVGGRYFRKSGIALATAAATAAPATIARLAFKNKRCIASPPGIYADNQAFQTWLVKKASVARFRPDQGST